MNMKNMKTTALPRLGKDAKRDSISLLILGKALMDFRGRNTLRVLSALRSAPGKKGMNSTIPISTTRKSRQLK
jgi:hypothetical protein|tara:strand:+ start:1690 stop:1908 length:219 start_codon:yes stop_codon:yes gene_type:complete